jgi:hypothetical protein
MLAAGAVVAQDLSAGKTSAQLFNSDCSACHHLPNGLGKKYNTGSLTDFLQAHYTTKTDSAGALARYLMGFAPLRAAPVTAPSAEEGVEGMKARGRASNLSSDGEKPLRPWPQSSEEPPKPAAAIGPAGPSRGRRSHGPHPRLCGVRGQPPGGGCRSAESGFRKISPPRRQ